MIVDKEGRMFEDRRKAKQDRRQKDTAKKPDRRKTVRRKENNKMK